MNWGIGLLDLGCCGKVQTMERRRARDSIRQVGRIMIRADGGEVELFLVVNEDPEKTDGPFRRRVLYRRKPGGEDLEYCMNGRFSVGGN